MGVTKVRAAISTVTLIANEATLAADVYFEGIGRDHQSFHDQTCCTVANQTITLHLTDSEAAVSRSTFSRLASEDCDATSCPRMHLVLNHVLEPLIEDRAREDVARQHLPSDAAHQEVLSIKTIAVFD